MDAAGDGLGARGTLRPPPSDAETRGADSLPAPPPPPARGRTNQSRHRRHGLNTTELEYAGSDEAANVVHLVRGFQARGHLLADLDPLGLNAPPSAEAADLTPESFGFSSSDLDLTLANTDMDVEVGIPVVPGVEGILGGALGTRVKLRVLVDALRATYCGTAAVEYMHIASREKANFIRSRVERDFAALLQLSLIHI